MPLLHPSCIALHDFKNPYNDEVQPHTSCQIISLELFEQNHDTVNFAKKAVLCSMGGMLVYFYLQQASLVLSSYPIEKRVDSRPMVFALGRSLGDYSDHSLLLLEGNQLRAVSLESGVILFHLDLEHVQDSLLEDNEVKGSSTKRITHRADSYAPNVQCVPCKVHWCEHTGNVIVGYVDGSVTLFYMEDGYYTAGTKLFESNVCERLYSQDTHGSPISCISTFQVKALPIAMNKTQSKSHKEVWLMISDEGGVMSLWSIPFKRSK